MSSLPDPIAEGLSRWSVLGGPHGALPESITVDVAIVGTGAGGGVTAEVLARAGLKVLLIEEGPLRSSRDFKQLESEAYAQLYQEAAGRKTADKAINILQGRCVGGSTTVNWTSSFRTPPGTLAFWKERFGLPYADEATMAPWFAAAEERFAVGDWVADPNPNNGVLQRGLDKLGLPAGRIRRNVKGCWNLGSCGMGCPTNAKQSMLVTTVPAALDAGARLFVQTRAERLLHNGRIVQGLECVPVGLDSGVVEGPRCRVTAKQVVLAGGAINSPGLLLRSEAPDPYERLGARTFLHPVALSSAIFEDRIDGWAGAPQTIYSDHFQTQGAIDGPLGFKLEVPPVHPLILATTMAGFGAEQLALLKQAPHTHIMLALLRDGFHPQSAGGQVRLRGDGSAVLDYPLNDAVFDGLRRALLAMAEIQFAAGASSVQPVHELAPHWRSWAEAKQGIALLPMQPYLMRVVSAHVMGGCGLAAQPQQGVTRPDGRHWQLENLAIHDGSLFPTSVGANPQLSIYGLVGMLSEGLLKHLKTA